MNAGALRAALADVDDSTPVRLVLDCGEANLDGAIAVRSMNAIVAVMLCSRPSPVTGKPRLSLVPDGWL